jgi:hypothetical protein
MVLKEAAAACIASYTGKDTNFRVRLSFWVERFGEKSITEIVPADIEAGIDLLAVKKKIRYVTRKGYIETGEYITGATVNRYVAALATMYKILKQRRRVPAGFRPPTLGPLKDICWERLLMGIKMPHQSYRLEVKGMIGTA